MSAQNETRAPPRRLLGFKNWRIALAVTGVLAVAFVAAVVAATKRGCNLAIGATGVNVVCIEPDHTHDAEQ
jgi:hypothetical protein